MLFHVPEIEIQGYVFKGLFKDVYNEDEKQVYFQKRFSVLQI